MKTRFRVSATLVSIALFAVCGLRPQSLVAAEQSKIRVLVITGGHGFEKEPFFKLFDSNPDLAVTKAEYPDAAKLLTPDLAKECDVILFYDMWAKGIEPEQQKAFMKLVKQGIGIFALHHTLAAHRDWDAYHQIIGGRYNLDKRVVNGVELPKSGFKHGVDIPVQIAKVDHPITAGMKDFTIHDETYINYETNSDVTVLLTTNEPTSDHELAWVKTFGKSRVFYLELGHDHFSYENPNFRQLIARGIAWTAGRL